MARDGSFVTPRLASCLQSKKLHQPASVCIGRSAGMTHVTGMTLLAGDEFMLENGLPALPYVKPPCRSKTLREC